MPLEREHYAVGEKINIKLSITNLSLEKVNLVAILKDFYSDYELDSGLDEAVFSALLLLENM